MASTRRSSDAKRPRKDGRRSRLPARRPKPGDRPQAAAAGWVLRCAPGLAKLLAQELRFRKAAGKDDRVAVLHQRNHDLLFLKNLPQAGALAGLRIAEERYRCLAYGRFKISNRQLDALAVELARSKVRRKLVVTADGDHFDRRDLGRWISRQLGERGVRLAEKSERLLWVFCVDQAYYICEAAPRGPQVLRPARAVERAGALPPGIAAAMAFAAKPDPGSLVLDPVCGSGTLLAEVAGYRTDCRLIGFDIDRKAVKAARANLAHLERVEVRHGDGAATGLAAGSVDLVLANLPFGKQYGDASSNPELYRGLVEEICRVGRPGRWRAVLLTSDQEVLRAALASVRALASRSLFSVRIRGEAAAAILVSPRNSR